PRNVFDCPFSAESHPASILLDFQKFYPKPYVPTLILRMRQWWVEISADPLVAAAARGDDLLHGEFVWFGCFAWLELIFEFPVFILGVRGSWNGSRSIYVLMLAYDASTATTVLPCIVYFLQEHLNMTRKTREKNGNGDRQRVRLGNFQIFSSV
ncbi:hypothetical protein C8R41DRAFT_752610, partial [Lentinula lateritia]